MWQIAHNRLAFQNFSAEQLWQELNDYAEKCKNNEVNASYSMPLIEMLAEHDYPGTSQICELIEDDQVKGEWLELFLIQLAAARKIEKAIPAINTRLAEDDYELTDTCTKALTQIGTETVIETLKQGCISGNWGYQLSASSILGKIKLPQSEQAILYLLDNHSKTFPHDIYCHLCFSLCDLCSNRAFHYGKKILDDIEAITIDSMRERLITLSRVLGTPLSPETRKQWEHEIAQEPQRRREYNRKHYPALYNFGELIRTRFGEDGNFIRGSDLDTERFSKRRIESIEPLPTELKIGRNDPCRCGSGKKYKRCCGKNSGLQDRNLMEV